MRNPSIHIQFSVLENLLRDIGVPDPSDVADQLLEKAKPYQIRNRILINPTKVLATKATNLIRTNISDTQIEIFNRLLDGERRALGHRGITVIHKDSQQYQQLKDVARVAMEFAIQFEFITIEVGYKAFIDLGIKMMNKKYALNKFQTYKERIYQTYAYTEEINNDDRKALTIAFYGRWQDIMEKNTGMRPDLTKEPDKYVSMIYGRQAAEAAGASFEPWIQAQFDALVFLNAIPELVQLYGDRAVHRYTKYVAKNKLTKESEPTIKTKTEVMYDEYLKALRG